MAEPCTCPEGRTLVEIEGEYFCEYIDSINPSCTITTCPEGYELIDNYCQIATQGLDLCPEGYTYDPQLKTCTLIETVEATCVCTADVIASPQAICSGETTNIVLTSTEPGISYTWTAVQSGVTGATSGNTSIISQTLNGAGTVTYTITPFETVSLCQGEPVQVVVTVNALPNLVVTAAQATITRGNPVSITMSSSTPGTVITWVASEAGGTANITGETNGSGGTITDTLDLITLDSTIMNYQITATTPEGCTQTITQAIRVNPTVAECLTNFIIDVSVRQGACSGHNCSHATFDLRAGSTSLGLVFLSNAGGVADQLNSTDPATGLVVNPGGGGNRYNRTTISAAQATTIAAANPNGNIVFQLVCDQTTGWNNFGGPGSGTCHTSAAEMTIYVGATTNAPVYAACPQGSSVTINVCSGLLV